jgi:hypothetical protein
MRRVCILMKKHFQESFKQATFESPPVMSNHLRMLLT